MYTKSENINIIQIKIYVWMCVCVNGCIAPSVGEQSYKTLRPIKLQFHTRPLEGARGVLTGALAVHLGLNLCLKPNKPLNTPSLTFWGKAGFISLISSQILDRVSVQAGAILQPRRR